MVSLANHVCLDRNIAINACASWILHCIIFYVVCAIDFNACMSSPFSPHSYALENATLAPNSSSIVGAVNPGLLSVYKLEAQQCAKGNMVLVVALESSPANISTSSDVDNVSYMLWLNMEGHNPLFDTDNDTILASTRIRSPSLDSCKPFTQVEQKVTCRQSYAFIKLQLSEAHAATMPWYVGVSSVGSPLDYYLKAWCSDDSTFSERKPCISVGTSGCLDIRENFVCAADQVYLTADQARVEVHGVSLQSGEWKYYTLNVSSTKSRILVEVSRQYGDVVLFLKPGDRGHKQEALPSEFDIDKYADKLGYQNRQNYHHYFFVGTGLFFIGIYNNDACVEETSLVNLTISTLSPQSSSYLCPRNCSYPNGRCISDLMCLCEADYGGDFCEGSLNSPNPKQNISGLLFPGQVAYFKMSKRNKVQDGSKWSIKFSRHGNNSILLANNGGFPTLANYSLAFSGNSSADLVEYHGDSETLSGGELIFGVFNLDYIVHQTSFYDIIVNNPGGKGLSTGLIVLATVSSSLLVCFAVAILERILHQTNSQSLALESGALDSGNGEDQNVSNEGGLDKGVIESFPLVLFKDIDLAKDKAQCPICLGDYVVGDILRKIPFCSHLFHVNCIEKWLVCSGSCPICRVALGSLNGRHWDRSDSDPLLRTGNPPNGSLALTELPNMQGDRPR